jgi:hypothetical protein
MRKLIGRAGALLLLMAAASVAPAGCAENDSSFFVRAAAKVDATTCVVTPTGVVELAGGTLDLKFSSTYEVALVIENQLVPRGNSTTLRTETSRISVYKADVRLLNGGGEFASFSKAVTGFADPGTSSLTPGVGVTFVPVLDGSVACALKGSPGEILAGVTLHGRTLGGLELTAPEFVFPITVCLGCLCSEAEAGSDMCGMGMPKANCRPGQDEPVDCRLVGTTCAAYQGGACQ